MLHLGGLQMVIDVSNDLIASIFRIKKSKNNDLTLPADSGTTSLRNFDQYSLIDNISHPRWLESFIIVLLGTNSFENQYYIVDCACSLLVWILRRTDSTDWHHSNEVDWREWYLPLDDIRSKMNGTHHPKKRGKALTLTYKKERDIT
jgi:hypothetical protein